VFTRVLSTPLIPFLFHPFFLFPLNPRLKVAPQIHLRDLRSAWGEIDIYILFYLFLIYLFKFLSFMYLFISVWK